jgi:class 3 adenylate cyclase
VSRGGEGSLLDRARTEMGKRHWDEAYHRAEATREGADWNGVEVHAAPRIGALAEGDEILLSRDTARDVSESFDLSEARTVSVKGTTRPIDVVSVEWQ